MIMTVKHRRLESTKYFFIFFDGKIQPCIIILNNYFINSFQPGSVEPRKLVEDISQTRKVLTENIPKSNLQAEASQVRCESAQYNLSF